MTEHDFNKDGPAIVIVLIIIFGIISLLVPSIEAESSSGEIKVVASYENCKIVRWVDPSMRYQYFLHCPT